MLMRITLQHEPRPHIQDVGNATGEQRERVMSKRNIHLHYGHLFEDLRERDQAQATEPRIDAVEHLRRSVDAELFRDVMGDHEYE